MGDANEAHSCNKEDLVKDESEDAVSQSAEMQLAGSGRRRRIHMDQFACYEHTNSSEGNQPLSNPSIASTNGDVNKGLYPVVRNRKRKSEMMLNEESMAGSPQLSQGFVSAANMYNIAKQKPLEDSFNGSENSSPFKRSKTIKQIQNQGSILSFMTVKPTSVTSKENNTCINLAHKQETLSEIKTEIFVKKESDTKTIALPHRTVMYSPIKKLGKEGDSSCIYISDSSPASSPCSSSQGSQFSQKESIANNAVVKKLFEAQKNLSSQKDIKKKKTKPKDSPALKQTEVEKVKHEAAKYFEGDSFDMDKAFASDLDDDLGASLQSKPSSAKMHVNDKYGLLGSGSYPNDETEKINYFELLPPEVLENIFCQLPMLDLCLNSNRVCLQWNNIIADEKVSNPIQVCFVMKDSCFFMQLLGIWAIFCLFYFTS